MDAEERHLPVAERLIREAIDSGEFDDLPGAGRPIPGAGRRDDDLWWVRRWIERNRVSPSGSGTDRVEPGRA